MEFLHLLGMNFSDREMMELTSRLDMDYAFVTDDILGEYPDWHQKMLKRGHKKITNVKWAESEPDGIELKFDKSDRLEQVYLYTLPFDDFEPVSQDDCDVPFFVSMQDAATHGPGWDLAVKKTVSGEDKFRGFRHEWVRHEYASHSILYHFRKGSLARILISRTGEPARRSVLERIYGRNRNGNAN